MKFGVFSGIFNPKKGIFVFFWSNLGVYLRFWVGSPGLYSETGTHMGMGTGTCIGKAIKLI